MADDVRRRAVQRFYDEVWNRRDVAAAEEPLSEDLVFRGSLGAEHRSRAGFLGYVAEVTDALVDYRCEIQALVADEAGAAARMRFSGRHVGAFRGYPPTGRVLAWSGAAFFGFAGERISALWVLGDMAGLGEQLRQNAGETS